MPRGAMCAACCLVHAVLRPAQAHIRKRCRTRDSAFPSTKTQRVKTNSFRSDKEKEAKKQKNRHGTRAVYSYGVQHAAWRTAYNNTTCRRDDEAHRHFSRRDMRTLLHHTQNARVRHAIWCWCSHRAYFAAAGKVEEVCRHRQDRLRHRLQERRAHSCEAVNRPGLLCVCGCHCAPDGARALAYMRVHAYTSTTRACVAFMRRMRTL